MASKKDVIQVLRRASEVISTPESWCQGTLWRDASGSATRNAIEAASCCIIGSVQFVLSRHYASSIAATQAMHALNLAFAAKNTRFRTLAHWNDSRRRKHEEVLDLLRSAEDFVEVEA